ncbi:MAG: hypothetical protein KAQ97_02100 [Candidatus Fermentibacteraceae bacterium]|nr:hypothetical protein [Candidatus Fermentibacteraceae bacterium]
MSFGKLLLFTVPLMILAGLANSRPSFGFTAGTLCPVDSDSRGFHDPAPVYSLHVYIPVTSSIEIELSGSFSKHGGEWIHDDWAFIYYDYGTRLVTYSTGVRVNTGGFFGNISVGGSHWMYRRECVEDWDAGPRDWGREWTDDKFMIRLGGGIELGQHAELNLNAVSFDLDEIWLQAGIGLRLKVGQK